ncbi:MAG: MnmC family methyltransferase [Candidatus Nezhaarchaeota archaeon]|nr:MnmC family methyltransferase [Candidatus Nezhaarchaeota archaeon]MCX8141710.1 MnmC family methyltransferase [Candidatus Nezhaarchaeota archaeon]
MPLDVTSIIVGLLKQRRYDLVDEISRREISSLIEHVNSLSSNELWNIIDDVTGGLGYTQSDKDISRLIIYGSYISWAEEVREGSKVLEIGTGLGRTCYTVLSVTMPSLYLTIDSSSTILAIALYRNPYPPFQEALWKPVVKICLCDALKAVNSITDTFDHIIHDGGPNPNRNPTLYSNNFLERLIELLKNGGSLSMFGSKSKVWQNKLYSKLRDLKLRVKTQPIPYSPLVVFHCMKD